MDVIARVGSLVLTVLVIFAFFELRYDALTRRDKDASSMYLKSTVYFRV